MIAPRLLLSAALIAFAVPAAADTLYVAAPPPAAPGHPMHLGADHRAQQVGDLVQIQFNFNVAANQSDVSAANNAYALTGAPGTGLLNLALLRLGAGISSSRQSSINRTGAQASSFISAMTATVTNVLPSGALTVAGDQQLVVNGQAQTLHVTGTLRVEDIDNTDTVLSTRLANVNAVFVGNNTEKTRGFLKRIVDFLFG